MRVAVGPSNMTGPHSTKLSGNLPREGLHPGTHLVQHQHLAPTTQALTARHCAIALKQSFATNLIYSFRGYSDADPVPSCVLPQNPMHGVLRGCTRQNSREERSYFAEKLVVPGAAFEFTNTRPHFRADHPTRLFGGFVLADHDVDRPVTCRSTTHHDAVEALVCGSRLRCPRQKFGIRGSGCNPRNHLEQPSVPVSDVLWLRQVSEHFQVRALKQSDLLGWAP